MVVLRASLSEARAANMAVVVVPMLLPRVRGYILSMLITPSPTRGVRVEVNTLLLCSRKVKITPIIMNKYLETRRRKKKLISVFGTCSFANPYHTIKD
jgi:hypothetical protein